MCFSIPEFIFSTSPSSQESNCLLLQASDTNNINPGIPRKGHIHGILTSQSTKEGLRVVFLLTVPRWFLCYSSSLFVHLWFLSKAVVPVLVLLFIALWFILRGDLFYVLPCVILFLCFSVLLALRLPRLGKRELILVLFVRLLDLRLFGFVGFLFLLVSGKGCGL